MNRKNLQILSIICVCVTVVALGFTVLFYNTSEGHKTQMRYTNERALSELVTSMSKIDTAIEKSAYSTTPSYTVSMLSEVFKETESAKLNLSSLDDGQFDTSTVQEFISKLGDYSLSLLKKVSSGEELTSEEREMIKYFANITDKLTIEIANMKTDYSDGNSKSYITEIKTFNDENAVEVNNMDSESSDVNLQTQDFATMIYDGPFSSHIEKMEPELLKFEQEISTEKALEIVAEFLEVDKSRVKYAGKIDAQIPVYKFTSNKEDDEIMIEVTVKGGHVLNFTNYREVKEYTKTQEETVEIAKEILEKSGYTDFVETYYFEENGIVTINFASTQEDVILYPDLLKLSIYRDDGTLAGVEARGYIMSHKTRDFENQTVSKTQAEQVVSNDLEILSSNMAIIPTSSKGEVLTYEFKCKNQEDKNYIVYVNAQTGQIENMLILIQDDNGTLTM